MLTQPYLIPINNRGEFELMEDYSYTWEEGSLKSRLTVKKGTKTDKASTPPFSWIIGFTKDGLWDAGSTLHDPLYQCEGRVSTDDPLLSYEEFNPSTLVWEPKFRQFTRQQCDRLFLNVMYEAGVSHWRAGVMWWAVATFGSLAW